MILKQSSAESTVPIQKKLPIMTAFLISLIIMLSFDDFKDLFWLITFSINCGLNTVPVR